MNSKPLPDPRFFRRSSAGRRGEPFVALAHAQRELQRRAEAPPRICFYKRGFLLNTFSVPATMLNMLHIMKASQINSNKNTRGRNNIWHHA